MFVKRISARPLISILLQATALVVLLCLSEPASAQTAMPVPERSASWKSATNIMALSSAGLVMIMPRIFYSDPEVTAPYTVCFQSRPSARLPSLHPSGGRRQANGIVALAPPCVQDAREELSRVLQSY